MVLADDGERLAVIGVGAPLSIAETNANVIMYVSSFYRH